MTTGWIVAMCVWRRVGSALSGKQVQYRPVFLNRGDAFEYASTVADRSIPKKGGATGRQQKFCSVPARSDPSHLGQTTK